MTKKNKKSSYKKAPNRGGSKKTFSIGQHASEGDNEMSENQKDPKLRPVPIEGQDGEHSFWNHDEKKLFIRVENQGGDMTKEVKVKVDYRGFGRGGNPKEFTPEELILPKLEGGKSVELEFELPTEDALETDFRFIIIIDEKGKLANFTNMVIGKCDISPKNIGAK